MALLQLPGMFQYIAKNKELIYTWLILIILFKFTSKDLFCQDDINRYDNILNPWLINPAYTGSTNNSVNFYANKQWLGIKGAPFFSGLNISGRLAPYDFYTNKMRLNKTSYRSLGRVGLGASLVSDKNGPFIYSGLKLNYAYHIQFNKNQLSFGLSNDFDLYNINETKMDPFIQNDPRIQGISRTKILYNPGFGVLYFNSSFDAGFAINNIFEKDIIVKQDFIEYPENHTTISLQGGYNFYPESDFSYQVHGCLSTYEFDNILYDITGGVIYRENYSFSLTYRNLGYFVAHFRIDIGKYNFIYGYSSPIGSLGRYIYGSHEISIGIRFGAYVF
jgi:type IX secretion system PorP/SprF family membrane protein